MNWPSGGSQAGIGGKIRHRQFQSGGIKGIRGKERDCRRTVPGKVMEGILKEEAFALGIDVGIGVCQVKRGIHSFIHSFFLQTCPEALCGSVVQG